jgi:hypothetical protein
MKSLSEFVADYRRSPSVLVKNDRDILSQYCIEIEEAIEYGEELTVEAQAIWDARPKMWADIRLKGTPDFSAKGAAVWGDCK